MNVLAYIHDTCISFFTEELSEVIPSPHPQDGDELIEGKIHLMLKFQPKAFATAISAYIYYNIRVSKYLQPWDFKNVDTQLEK